MYKYEKAAIERFGNNFIRNKTDELIFNCKKCGRPKLYVDTKTGVYHCFRCNFKGKIKTRATLAGVREKYNMDTLIKQTKENKDEQLTLIHFVYKPLTEQQIKALNNRGITSADIKYYNICGRAEDERIQIPNFVKGCFTDVICAWEWDKSKVTNKNPKYLNSEGTEKSKTLFNIYNIDNNPEQIVLCEGLFNAITAGKNAVASYGCSLSSRQCDLILEKEPKSILIAYDSDEPGVNGAVEAIRLFKLKNYKGKLEYILLPKGVDINDLGHDNFKHYCETHSVVIDVKNPIGEKLPKLLFDSKSN